MRVELWGDEIDSIRSFDWRASGPWKISSHTSTRPDEMPAVVDGKYVASVSMLDYFHEEAAILLDEPGRLMEKAMGVAKEFQESMVQRLEKGYRSEEPTPELLTPGDIEGVTREALC